MLMMLMKCSAGGHARLVDQAFQLLTKGGNGVSLAGSVAAGTPRLRFREKLSRHDLHRPAWAVVLNDLERQELVEWRDIAPLHREVGLGPRTVGLEGRERTAAFQSFQ